MIERSLDPHALRATHEATRSRCAFRTHSAYEHGLQPEVAFIDTSFGEVCASEQALSSYKRNEET